MRSWYPDAEATIAEIQRTQAMAGEDPDDLHVRARVRRVHVPRRREEIRVRRQTAGGVHDPL